MDIERIRRRFSSIRIIDYDPKYFEGTMIVAHEIHEHSIYADMPFDEQKVIRQLSASGNIVPDRFFKLAVRDAEVLGGFYGCVQRVFFCDVLTAKDMGWWVKSTVRGGAAAVLLLGAFEDWAREQGAVKIGIGQSGVENIKRTGKLFLNCGYVMTGFNTAKQLR